MDWFMRTSQEFIGPKAEYQIDRKTVTKSMQIDRFVFFVLLSLGESKKKKHSAR